jgi:hypothetical protein
MKRFPAVLFLLLLTVAGWSQGLEDWYAAISNIAGIDQNAGETTFLTLVIPSGGMYQAMGTAYSAVLKDSGYLEANPAGSALLKETELSVYHNDWIGQSRIETAVFTIHVPVNKFVSEFLGVNDVGLGAGAKYLYLPFDAVDTYGDRYKNSWSSSYATGYYSEFIGTLNGSATFFGDYYFHGVTLGANVKAAVRSVPESIAQGQSAFDIALDFGALTRFNFLKFYPSRERNLSFSFVLKNVGAPVMGDPLPTAFVFGIAYSPIRPLTVSADYTIPYALGSNFSFSNMGQFFSGSQSEQPSVATGMNLAMTSFFALQAGLEIKPGRPRFTTGATVNLEKLTVNVSYTVDLMTTLAVPDRLAVEVKLNLGDLGRKEAEDRARELYLTGLEAYAKGNLEDAVVQWDKALEILPTFKPAQELRETAQKAIDLRAKMETNQKIE